MIPRWRATERHSHQGFSLVELIVVMAISSLVAATVVVNWTGNLSSARLTNAIETIVELDRQTRLHALNHGKPCVLEIDVRSNELSVTRWQGSQRFSRNLGLGSGVEIDEVGYGSNEIVFTHRASSPTYYIKLKDRQKRNRWLLIAGGTGQNHIFENEKDLKKMLQNLRAAGVDAG